MFTATYTTLHYTTQCHIQEQHNLTLQSIHSHLRGATQKFGKFKQGALTGCRMPVCR